MAETVALTMGELDRLQVMSQLAERRLTRRGAAALLGLSERQVRRLYRAFRRDGATALASRHRGRPSNRQLATATREQALTLVRERYVDFGPTFAHQKLTEQHGLAFSVETLRGWMTAVGLWVPRAQRLRRSQPPRPRRACLGELVQIDGSEHAGFEDRGPVCTFLVYVDDATSRLMELAFAAVESTFDYFRATRRYLGAPRKADGLLQRSTQRLSCPRPRARSERPWALTIRARPAGAQHRPPLRTQSRSQGAGRTGQRHLAGPARQRAAVARPQRSRRRRPVPSRVHGRLQPALRQTARRGLRRASPAAPRRRPHPALHPCRRRVASVASSPCTTNAISTCSTTRSPPGDGAARRWSSAKPRTARSP